MLSIFFCLWPHSVLKMELSKEKVQPMEVGEPSIVNNNHVNKKKQSKSRS